MGASTYLLAGQVSELERLRTEAEKPDRWGRGNREQEREKE